MLLIVGITFLSFLLIYHSPGDPATVALKKAGMRVSEEAVEQKREELGLNDPFLVQYGRWLYSFSHGDLGDSYKTGKPVADELKKTIPATLLLTVTALAATIHYADACSGTYAGGVVYQTDPGNCAYRTGKRIRDGIEIQRRFSKQDTLFACTEKLHDPDPYIAGDVVWDTAWRFGYRGNNLFLAGCRKAGSHVHQCKGLSGHSGICSLDGTDLSADQYGG